MRKFWFDLREAIGRAEETIAGHQAHPASEPPEPWLALDANTARLWCTPVNAPCPRSIPLTAVHVDVDGAPVGEPGPLCRQPLAEPDTDGESTLERLRSAAGRGDRWLVADVSTTARFYTAAALDTDTPPETAVWTPAWLAAGDLGPYPGQVAHGYQHHGCVIARFDRATVQRIAVDAEARAARSPRWDADLLVLRDYGSGMEVFAVHAPASLARRGESPQVGMRHIAADPDGWYRLTDDRWPWRHATAPTLPSHRRQGWQPEREPDVFAADGAAGIRCTVCGATGWDVAHEELPSMAGYGTDTATWCKICGSSESYAEEIGWSSRRTVWPPTLDPTPAAGGGEVTRS